MSVNLGTVHVSLEMRLQKLKDGIRDAKSELGGFESDTKRRVERIGQSMTNLGRSMSIGITAPLVLMGKSAVESAVRMDSLTRSLTSLTGNSKETEKQLIRLREAAKLPGLGFRELIEGSVRLQSAGLNAKQAEAALKGFGNALALAGGSKEDLREVGVQLAQIASSGKLQGDELRIIAERVPQVRAVLKEAFGTASSEEISKFGLSVEQILGAITNGLEKLPQATDSVQNKFDNFNDTLDDLKRTVGTAFLPAVTDGLELMARKVEEATKWFNELEPAAKDGLGKLAVGGAIMGPALLGLGVLSGWFAKISASPFFKFLTGAIKAQPLQIGPGLIGGLMPQTNAQRAESLFQEALAEERARFKAMGKPNLGMPSRADLRKLPANPLGPGFKLKKRDTKAESDAKRRAEFAEGYESDAQIDILRATGHQFKADILEARQEAKEAIARGARRVDAERVMKAKIQEIWNQYYEWKAGREDKLHRKESAIGEERLRMHFEQVKAFDASRDRVSAAINSLRNLGGPQTSGAWAKFGRFIKGPQPETLGAGQVAQGQELLATAAQLAEMERQRSIDAMRPGILKPMGDLFGENLAQELKPKVQPFTFQLGKVLGDNLAMEMGREFGTMFDKVFGTGNPLARALSNTLSRLVDDLIYSLAQRAIGQKLMLSLFGGAAGGLAGTGTTAAAGMTGAGLMGGGGGAAAGGAKAAGISAGTAWTVGFAVAATWGFARVMNSIFKGSPAGRANLQARFSMDPGFRSQAMQLSSFSGMPVNVYFNGAQFNNDQDPKRAASRLAWHVSQQMKSRPGS